MNQVFSILIIVGGGLGTFLLGMKHLSEGLQAVSGSGLRRFMSLATSHRLAGVGTGVITTVIVQSSSIITVMVVGFVSSGLMNLSQAINVIIGSNIGTTATAWLIAFAPDVEMLGLCVILVGTVLYFFQLNERLHNLGLAFMGLGCIFIGLYWMKEGMEPVRTMPMVVDAFRSLDATTAWGLAKCVLVSLAFTAVVQSSAATTAIAMTLAQQGLLSFEAAAATVFGMNIGTTMTAWLAAFNGSAEARQTALAHTLFNVAGTILLIPFFVPAILPLATSFFPHYADAVTTNGVTTYPPAHGRAHGGGPYDLQRHNDVVLPAVHATVRAFRLPRHKGPARRKAAFERVEDVLVHLARHRLRPGTPRNRVHAGQRP